MTDLWASERQRRRRQAEPLAVRMRPRTLDEFAGQRHVLGDGGLLRRMLDAGRLSSLLLWGPPGTGKTTLAEVIAGEIDASFERANAASIGVRQIREIIDAAAFRLETSDRRTVLFLDEIHRFARNQQDVLLADVESGLITLIGATTENPYFAVNSALVSRATVLRFEPLDEDDVAALLRRAVTDERGLAELPLEVDDDAISHWARTSDGDARRALTALEVAALSTPPGEDARIVIDLASAEQSIQTKALVYDGTGDEHYDIVSAFIKSMRGSDPDATVYWLARMLEAGEDPRFIARRIAILASEDIGNADPQAIQVAAAAWTIAERVGMPECRLTLSQAAIYMAAAPKSNAATTAIGRAAEDVRTGRTVPVPRHLRDAHYAGAAALGHGENYVYPHDLADGYAAQEYLGVDREYYIPSERGFEAEIKARLQDLRGRAAPPESPPELTAGEGES